MSKSNNPPKDVAKPQAVRRTKNAPIADTARPAKAPNAPSKAADPRTPPPNARVVQPSYKTGTVSRAAVRAAVKRLSSRS
jgi:hypothetical protein